jgi:hypothetical protein
MSRAATGIQGWLPYVALIAIMFVIVRVDGARPDAFPDIVAVRCAGQMLNSGSSPYANLRTLCGPNTLDFFYPPVVARFSATTLAWLSIPTWMLIFDIAYAISFATLIMVAFRLLHTERGTLAAFLAVAGVLAAYGGGVAITGFRSGNIAVIFWAALAAAVLGFRNARLATLVIIIGSCIKIYLLYLLVVPALMRRDLRLPVAAGCIVLLAYLLQWYFEPELFASYGEEVRALSQTPGYAGASSMQLGTWIAAATGIPVLRLLVVGIVSAALIWRSRHLVRVLLTDTAEQDEVQLRSLAVLLLVLAVLSPRVTHYDLLILLPVFAVLLPLPSQRAALALGCVIIPWACRLALTTARLEPLKSWLLHRFAVDYSTLWNFYLCATWAAIASYAWFALGRTSIDAVIGRQPDAWSPVSASTTPTPHQ